MGLNSKLAVSVTADLAKTLDLAEARVTLNKVYQSVLSSGVIAGAADLVFHDTRTVAPSANDDLDLAGVLLDPLGAALTFVKIKGLIVVAAAANANNVLVGGQGAAAFGTWVGDPATDKVVLRPGAMLALFAGQADATGYVVTPTTADILRVANSAGGTSVTYDVIIIGTSV